MSDEYIPLLMKLSRTGKITITKDTQLDTGSNNGVSGRIRSEEEDI